MPPITRRAAYLCNRSGTDSLQLLTAKIAHIVQVTNIGYNSSMDEQIGLSTLRGVFCDTTGLTVESWRDGDMQGFADLEIIAGGKRFIVEYKASATSEDVGSAIRQIATTPTVGSVPLIVVPYMGDAGRRLCHDAGVSWLDLSGNADINAPPIRIRILCEQNRYKRSGRPQSLFAPRSARLARTLLLQPSRTWPQTELVRATGLNSGYLSRLLPRYAESGYVAQEQMGRTNVYTVVEPDALLDAWNAEYDFNHHTILRGHIAARDGLGLLRDLSAALNRSEVKHAATGLAGAWLWEPFAAFRTVTLYMSAWPSAGLLADLGFNEGARGSNTWLVVPDDAGVFAGQTDRDGIPCVSAAQVYVDLKAQPERAEEAQAELRRTHLSWTGAKQKGEP